MSLSMRPALSIGSVVMWLVTAALALVPGALHAESPVQAAVAAESPAQAAVAPASICAPLVEQLRWHEPFFGLREWRDVAQETISYATPSCRTALSQGAAPEVVAALSGLAKKADDSQPQLRRYVYRVACQLRTPALHALILAGTHQPGVYVDCVDAVFAMGESDEESVSLRERYLDGLTKEPLTTPIPPSVLKPPYVERLAPVLAAYETAQKPKRDTIYEALCMHHIPTSAESKKVCSLPPLRESNWALERLLTGNISDGVSYLHSMPGHELPLLVPLLYQFDAEHRRGRDKMHRVLCQQRVLASPKLLPACQALRDEAEPRWLHAAKLKELNDEVVNYHKGAVWIGKFLGAVALLIILHALLWNRRRAQLDPAVQIAI